MGFFQKILLLSVMCIFVESTDIEAMSQKQAILCEDVNVAFEIEDIKKKIAQTSYIIENIAKSIQSMEKERAELPLSEQELRAAMENNQRKYIEKTINATVIMEEAIQKATFLMHSFFGAQVVISRDDTAIDMRNLEKARIICMETIGYKAVLEEMRKALRDFMKKNRIVPFRIGFEFQMGGSVLPWTSDESYEIQKTPIFEMYSLGKKLWHIEIDGNDIEFVTEPFSYSEPEVLVECMKNIGFALNKLKIFDKTATFSEWVYEIEKSLYNTTCSISKTPFFEVVANKPIDGSILDLFRNVIDYSPSCK